MWPSSQRLTGREPLKTMTGEVMAGPIPRQLRGA